VFSSVRNTGRPAAEFHRSDVRLLVTNASIWVSVNSTFQYAANASWPDHQKPPPSIRPISSVPAASGSAWLCDVPVPLA
jgi:hypothetical protein